MCVQLQPPPPLARLPANGHGRRAKRRRPCPAAAAGGGPAGGVPRWRLSPPIRGILCRRPLPPRPLRRQPGTKTSPPWAIAGSLLLYCRLAQRPTLYALHFTCQRKFAMPCDACAGKGTYACRLCKGSTTIEWSPMYDPVFINPCLCPTCDGTRSVIFCRIYISLLQLGTLGSCDLIIASFPQGAALLELPRQRIRLTRKCVCVYQ